MLNEMEIELLRIMNENMLMRKEELDRKLHGSSDVYSVMMTKLISEGYINNLDSIGSQCFAITQKGIRAISQ